MIKRVLTLLPVVLGVLCLTFMLMHLVPGDPVDVMLGESASAADREALKQQLGLDLPLWQQLFHYTAHLLQGDFGVSIHTHTAIAALLQQSYPATLLLALAALAIGLTVGVPLGVWSALKAGHWQDVMITLLSIRVAAMPAFWLGPLLMLVFAVWLGWLPVSGMDSAASLVLPALTLGLGLSAILTRMTRTSLLEVLHEDYIRTARAKGLSEQQVILKHALRAALLPLVTIVGLQMGSLLAGAVITETIFGWNGIGRLLVESIEKRDYPVTQACVLVIALSYVLINQATDLAYRWLDPRTRGRA
ncbi:nickel ABC transporter permease [Methylophilus sp. 3sh_L]|uniref:nickel ABC transporter permease n=1 Tax=Methylophilus sp. 3sh_L TaxID=3377114 RepID=UPI00398F49F8